VTEPDRSGLKPGHWVLIAMAVLLVAGLAYAVVRPDLGREPEAGPSPTPTAATTSAPACLPTVAEIGYTRTRSRIDFGLIARSDCPSAAVNSLVDVTALDADGKSVSNDPYARDLLNLPVILPGQRLGLAGTLLVDPATKVSRLTATVSGSQALPVSEFSTWARSATVTDLKHTGPDASGFTTVTGTLVTDPPNAKLCNPDFTLILRDKDNNIIYGMTTTKNGPTFEERFPAATDYTRGEAYVVQGVFTLWPASGARSSCRAP
jgi:hypothetical protein